MTPIHEKLRLYAPWLFKDRRFDVTMESYDPKAFGNSEVVLESPEIRMRFVSDRGQVSAEFQSPSEPDRWLDLLFILEAICGRAPQPIFDLDRLLVLLQENFDGVLNALVSDWPRTREVLDRKRLERLQALRAKRPGPEAP